MSDCSEKRLAVKGGAPGAGGDPGLGQGDNIYDPGTILIEALLSLFGNKDKQES